VLHEHAETHHPKRRLRSQVKKKKHTQRVRPIERINQRHRDVAVVINSRDIAKGPRLRRLRKAPQPRRHPRHENRPRRADKAEQWTPDQVIRAPERLAGHDVIQNQARQQEVHAQVQHRPVGLLIQDSGPPDRSANAHNQKERNDITQNLQVLVHGSC
jgi:hypothetical protein